MRTWLNNKCDNSEGNMCMCVRCRCVREIGDPETGLLPKKLPDEWVIKFAEWECRMDGMEKIMKGRFPDEDS